MKSLLRSWDILSRQWEGKAMVLFLDYDGTLSPIAERPQDAILPRANKELLARLVACPDIHVVVISGRSLADIKALIGISAIDYIGNHGWEIEGPHIRFETLVDAQLNATLESIKYELDTKLSSIKGAFVEDKGVTLSVHYRQVAAKEVALVKEAFNSVSLPYRRKKKIRTAIGKKVLEIRPPLEWDKGKAAIWLLKKQELIYGTNNVVAVYVGDDVSDEDAFKVLKQKGTTVFVGTTKGSHADYYLDTPDAVTEFLTRCVAWAEGEERHAGV